MQVINFRNGQSVMADRHIQGGQYSKTCIRTSGILAAMMVPSRQAWNLSSCLSSRLLKGLGLVTFVMLLLIGCGGGGSGGDTGGSGGGDGGGGDGGGGNGGDGTGGQVSIPAEVEWIVIPFDGGLRIQWDNVVNFSQAGVFVHLNLTGDDSPRPIERRIPIGNFTDNSYEIAGLVNGTAYRLVGVAIEFADNTSRVIGIDWLWADNELNNTGSGIVVGPNYDNDSLADSVDTDDDNDGIDDAVPDRCAMGETGWRSDNTTDNDGDGCRDRDEDADDDNDGLTDMADVAANCQFNPDCDNDEVLDGADSCVKGETGWQSNTTTDYDGDGCRDMGEANGGYGEDADDDNDEVLDRDEVVGCELKPDCDSDMVGDNADNCPAIANSDQLDTDNDTTGDVCDGDKDGDSVANGDEVMGCELLADCDSDMVGDSADNCPATANSDQLDTDNDTTGDVCDGDKDGDSVANGDEVMGCELLADCDSDMVGDSADNCPLLANSDQLDTDNDTTGDVCDGDKDGDSVANGEEVMGCELNSDCDGDNEPDNVDIDADGDGLIEIAMAAELDAVRYVLNGTGFVATAGAQPNQTGCGDGGDITACNGYELIRDISLTDYIAANYAMVGWQPIAHDTDGRSAACQGGAFSGIFDGNGFKISGLWINRSQQDCIGLFGHTSGSIRNLGVIADRIMGNGYIGGLVGRSTSSASIVQSYAVNGIVNGRANLVGGLVGFGLVDSSIVESYAISGEVRGFRAVGGLVGSSRGPIIRSYVVNGEVRGINTKVGGLVGYGDGEFASIVQSYAISGEVRGGNNEVGGLVGDSRDASIIQSYAISGLVNAKFRRVGGLVGENQHTRVNQSYAVSGPVDGSSEVGGLVGAGGSATASYWDIEASGITNDSATGSFGQTSSALRSPTGYDGIYAGWGDGLMVDAINANATIWCDEDNNDRIDEDERRDNTHADGDNRVWDFGTASDYPVIRCTVDSPADQRAWWSLNSTGQPALNQTRLDAWLDGSLP